MEINVRWFALVIRKNTTLVTQHEGFYGNPAIITNAELAVVEGNENLETRDLIETVSPPWVGYSNPFFYPPLP